MITEQNIIKVSVVIPYYNQKLVFDETIQTVFNQSYPIHEIIVVDDDSTDGSGTFLESYGDKILYIHQKNKGPAGARNAGIQLATGELIALLDGDDKWHPQKIEEQVDLYQKTSDPKIGLIDCYCTLIDRSSQAVVNVLRYSKKGNVFKKLLYNNIVNQTSAVVIKKSVFDDVGLFNESLQGVDDREMWIRIAEKYAMYTVPKFLSIHVRDEKGLSTLSSDYTFMKKGSQEMWKLLIRRYNHLLTPRQIKKIKTYSEIKYLPEYLKRGEYKQVRKSYLCAIIQFPQLFFGNNGKYTIAFVLSFLGKGMVEKAYGIKRSRKFSAN